ncbi:MAG: DEAD/DEAH box helicase [Candidatus Omnitrophica bacterium]|nr:DEAD/DEAH box helicase [Candidatus Omnitrophota bacterium]
MNKSNNKSAHPIIATGAFTLLMPELQRAVSDSGYHTPTPIQEQVISHLLSGRDMIGCAQTGTGKTAAFTLPILQYLAKNPGKRVKGKTRVLVLAPTRELAAQIGDSVKKYGKYLKVSYTVIFGGVSQNHQVRALASGVEIIVATPGRLLDLMNQRHVHLDAIEVFVLDEADRMLDMGFIHDVKRIVAKLPKKRQTLFFSATMEPEVVKLSKTLVDNAVFVSVTPDQPTVERIEQKVFFVDKNNKDLLLAQLLEAKHLSRVLVFVQMKFVADRVVKRLLQLNINAIAIHGNKSQGARTGALDKFKQGEVRVLVATDIAARGIDVSLISHVINYDLPMVPETYVHRIGRTARAGTEGDAVSFCSAPERDSLRCIEKMIRMVIPVDRDHDFHSKAAEAAKGEASRPPPHKGRPSRNQSSSRKPAAKSKNFSGSWQRKPKTKDSRTQRHKVTTSQGNKVARPSGHQDSRSQRHQVARKKV